MDSDMSGELRTVALLVGGLTICGWAIADHAIAPRYPLLRGFLLIIGGLMFIYAAAMTDFIPIMIKR
jgi:hypothetical protein